MEEKILTGRLYDVQGFSVQDGPGVRTTAFLKGCPLHCPWCHSPESQAFYKQLSWMSMRCLGVDACKQRCIMACPNNAIELGVTQKDVKTGTDLQLIHVKRDLCDNCGKCADACYVEALYLCGKDYTVDELVNRLLQDKKFYDRSGGGVTISGGEALSQLDFVVAVLKRLKNEGIHTALDTTGYAKWEKVALTMPYVDLYLYDLKHLNSEKHQAVVGVPNEVILDNALKLAENGKKLQIRIPVIPMFNYDEKNIRDTAHFCKRLGTAVEVVQLLPYHNLGVMKYLRLSDDPVAEATLPNDAYIEKLKGIFEEYGLPVTVH